MKLYEIIFNKIKSFFVSPVSRPDVFSRSSDRLSAKTGEPVSRTVAKNSPEEDQGIGINLESTVKIDTIDTVNSRFKVKEIRKNLVFQGDKSFIDYVLSEPNTDDFRLRIFKDSHDNNRAVILKIHDSLEYDQGFHDLVKNSEEFEMHDDLNDNDESNDIHEKFWRIDDVKIAYSSRVVVKKSPKENAVELIEKSFDFWDFSRMTEIDSVELEEFVFVEMDKETGMFTIWRGTEIPVQRITTF